METWLLQQGDVRHHRTEQDSYDVARGVNRYVCLSYLLLLLDIVHLVYCVYWCLLVMERWNTMQYIPVHHSGHGDELLLFVKCSEIARDCPTQRPGNKTSLSLWRLFFAEISVYIPLLLKQCFLQSSTVHYSLKNKVFRSRPLAYCNREAGTTQMVSWYCLGCALWQCRIGFFHSF